MSEREIENILRQVLAHVSWLRKGDMVYNELKGLISKNKEKREELVALLSEGVFK